MDEINASISSLISASKERVLARISSTAGDMTSRLDVLGASLISVSNGTATLNTSLGQVKSELDTIGAWIEAVSGDIALVRSSLGAINVSLSELGPKLTQIQEEMLVFDTELETVNVNLRELNIESIQLDERTVQIQTDTGRIVSILEELTGITVPIETTSGDTNVTLITDMELLSTVYRESEKALDIKYQLTDQGAGRLTVIIPKGMLELFGSSLSDVKLGEDGKEVPYSVQELAGVYLLQAMGEQGQHQLTLYIKGWPMFSTLVWAWILPIPLVGALALVIFFKRRKPIVHSIQL